MGERGPVPKRASQRRRRNKDSEPETVEAPVMPVGAPPVKKSWHPVARQWYEALASSGQATFYEASDWATAYLIAEAIDRELKPQVVGTTDQGKVIKASLPPKGASLSAWLKAMSSLLVTEGDRRRVQLEVERRKASSSEEAADVSDFARYRARLRGESG